MEGIVKIEVMVLELLGLHNCVTIPGLGSFIYRETQATSNTFTFEIRPSIRTIFFNSAIASDDGIVVNELREKTGSTYNQALSEVEKMVAELKAQLAKNRNLVFGKLGNFFINAEEQIFFFPSPSLNLSHETFGLPVIRLDELEKAKQLTTIPISKPVVEETPKEKPVLTAKEESNYEDAEVVHIELEKPERSRSWIWKVAAAVALLMLAGTGYFVGKEFFKSRNQKSEQISAIVPVDSGETIAPDANTTATIDTPSTAAPQDTAVDPIAAPAPQPEAAPTPAVEEAPAPVPSESLEVDLQTQLQQAKGKFFVVGGMYMDQNLAALETRLWASKNIKTVIFKAENSSLYKVIFQRFATATEAQAFVSALPQNAGTPVAVKEIKSFK